MHRLFSTLSLLAIATAASAETIRYSFKDPVADLHGWTTVMGEAGFQAGGLGSAKAMDEAHPTLLVRSPQFRIDEGGKIVAKLKSGKGGTIPTSALALSTKTSDPGPMGIALRRVTDDAWLISGKLNKDGSGQEVVFSKKELTALYNEAPDEVYTLDFFDAEHGGWGHVELLEVSLDGRLVEVLPKPPAGFEDARPLFLGVLHGKLAYDKKDLYATPGSKVSLTLFNSDEMAHNWLLCKPDPKVADELGLYVMENIAAMTAADYIPKDPRILFHSALVAPGNSDTQYITIPDKKGGYPFVCTFPGHHILMRGILHVVDKLPVPKANEVTKAEPENPYLVKAGDRPVILRGPLQGGTGGSAVVSVGLPNGISYSFDTYTCVISNVWQADSNSFIDTKPAWAGRGGKAMVIRGQVKHQNKVERQPNEVRFRGYEIKEDGNPVFEYQEGGKVIRIRAEAADQNLLIHHESDGAEPRTETIKLSN